MKTEIDTPEKKRQKARYKIKALYIRISDILRVLKNEEDNNLQVNVLYFPPTCLYTFYNFLTKINDTKSTY